MLKKLVWLILPLWLLSLSGCALCVGGAIGAAAGYHLRDDGYKVRSPLYKGGKAKSSRSEKY